MQSHPFPSSQVRWVRRADDQLYSGIHALFHSVVELDGAIGFLAPPSLAETREWVSEVVADVVAGDAGLAVVGDTDGEVQALGCWRRERAAVFGKVAGLHKVATHPASRGRGFGRTVVRALVEDAANAGVEVVSLGTRGNNHNAIALYRSLGFTEWGRLPNSIAIGNKRYDDVRMFISV